MASIKKKKSYFGLQLTNKSIDRSSLMGRVRPCVRRSYLSSRPKKKNNNEDERRQFYFLDCTRNEVKDMEQQ